MAINTVDDIAAAIAVSPRTPFLKNFTAPKAAGAFQSGWLATGLPVAGVAPPAYNSGSGYTSDDATTGAMRYTNASVQNYLARIAAMSSQPGTLILMDRLWSCSGMGFAAGTYTVTTPGSLPPRITDNGLGCELFIEQYVAAGAASGTATANYVDSGNNNVSGVVAAVVSAPVAGQLQPVPMANNLGIKSLTSIVTSATWTSGSFGALIAKRVAEISVAAAGIGEVQDWARTGLRDLPNDCCLMLAWMAANTTAPVIIGSIDIIDK